MLIGFLNSPNYKCKEIDLKKGCLQSFLYLKSPSLAFILSPSVLTSLSPIKLWKAVFTAHKGGFTPLCWCVPSPYSFLQCLLPLNHTQSLCMPQEHLIGLHSLHYISSQSGRGNRICLFRAEFIFRSSRKVSADLLFYIIVTSWYQKVNTEKM